MPPHLEAKGLSNILELGYQTLGSLSLARVIGRLLGLSLLSVLGFQLFLLLFGLFNGQGQLSLSLLSGDPCILGSFFKAS